MRDEERGMNSEGCATPPLLITHCSFLIIHYFIIHDNAAISDNSAGNAGGGIITFTDTKNGYISQITMSGSAVISGNTAGTGGGILLQDKLSLEDSATITGNTAAEEGGGVYAAGKNIGLTWDKTFASSSVILARIPSYKLSSLKNFFLHGIA